jgi:hypothetical protein
MHVRPEKSARLVDLATQVKALADSAEHARRRRLWQDAMDLRTTHPPVNFYLHESVWARELATGLLRFRHGLDADLERQLALQLWRSERVCDDVPAAAAVVIGARRPPDAGPIWGVELAAQYAGAGGAYKPIPAIRTEGDLDRLTPPQYQEDREATSRTIEQARALIDDVLPVVVAASELHWGPFEHAVRLRGMDNLLLDVYDRPAFVRRLMDRITTGMVDYHRQREQAGRVTTRLGFNHVPWSEPVNGKVDRLQGCWVYCHAQSSASFSPQMYAEFVHPFNCRIAALAGRVYYHGCEDLSHKAAIISGLPNLRLFHVSPWTPPGPVVEKLGSHMAYELHSHPTEVFFGGDQSLIRRKLAECLKVTADAGRTITLADVETLNGRFDRAVWWVRLAKELATSVA